MAEQSKAEDEGAKKDENIGQIENAGLYRTNPDDHEIGYSTTANESIQEIAATAAGNKGKRCPDGRVIPAKSQQVDKTCAKQQGNEDIEKYQADLDRQVADDSQEAAVIFDQRKFDYPRKSGNFLCRNEDTSGRILCYLVAADW